LTKLAILGAGKMGKLLAQLAPESGFTLVATIQRTYFIDEVETAANFRADVVIEFQERAHGRNSTETMDFTLAPAARPNTFSGTAGRDTLNVVVAPATQGLEAAQSYAVRYMHGNHFDSAQCLNLRQR